VRMGGLGKLKKSNDLIGNRTRDLPACSVVPQPTMNDKKARMLTEAIADSFMALF
jgi:hypothetical protein